MVLGKDHTFLPFFAPSPILVRFQPLTTKIGAKSIFGSDKVLCMHDRQVQGVFLGQTKYCAEQAGVKMKMVWCGRQLLAEHLAANIEMQV